MREPSAVGSVLPAHLQPLALMTVATVGGPAGEAVGLLERVKMTVPSRMQAAAARVAKGMMLLRGAGTVLVTGSFHTVGDVMAEVGLD